MSPLRDPVSPAGRPVKRLAAVAALALPLIVAGLAVAAVRGSRASLTAEPGALARVHLSLGASVVSASAVSGPHASPVPLVWRGARLLPAQAVPAGQTLSLQVTVRRPGWLAWLTGSRQRLRLSVRAPTAALAAEYVTLAPGAPLRVRFTSPVLVVWTGTHAGHLQRRWLSTPEREVTLEHAGRAGSLLVAGAPEPWESAPASPVSWFPAGGRAGAVVSPAPGTGLSPGTPIRLTFSTAVASALGSARPQISPATPGSWRQAGPHTLVFEPSGAGYGLDTAVTLALPSGIRLVAGQATATATVAHWSVPAGSTGRLQQLLAMQGYLPVAFRPDGAPVPNTWPAQERAAVHPPGGRFSWRYADIPAPLRTRWAPGQAGTITRGAVMAFEAEHGLATDGVAGPQVWQALIAATLNGQRSSFGYSFVEVSVATQRLMLWHDGRTLLRTKVNTGARGTPTQPGTFAVYEHLRVTTMSGTNPDGSHYHDPGIQFVSYFNGGDALHAFTRAQYGFPQSLGCVEMPLGPAGRVWPYTPIGTLVHVA